MSQMKLTKWNIAFYNYGSIANLYICVSTLNEGKAFIVLFDSVAFQLPHAHSFALYITGMTTKNIFFIKNPSFSERKDSPKL